MRPIPVKNRIGKNNIDNAKGLKGNKLIRHYHNLLKEKSRLIASSAPIEKIKNVESELENIGIDAYQRASRSGQAEGKGGDSSKILIKWIRTTPCFSYCARLKEPKDLLEIGSVSVDNKCSTCGLFRVSRIDLHSVHPLIKQQDFLERTPEEGLFTGISCSLVLNFAPPELRAKMLLHCTGLLMPPNKEQPPWLFLVLPSPCITNSRYMDEKTLHSIMIQFGFICRQKSISKKIAYYLYSYECFPMKEIDWKKKIVNDGATRNNFFIPCIL
ncbi:rRNA (adenine) methyltransferase activity Bmt2 [Schizosaccharomyces pombe]|uniref:25S rRNA adenine-N(1) methyltransferase n=1 Tax=Schizosaccharomyces pombe (strain 972 / ATCC 24843) TaxID=284812 RepID=BMT2_SCHPO|nr:uncharacterized protein SPAC630.10 [Schizosaccharomyces pombe]Q9UUH2.1 RecName: Full=25S rRNA adenine-N(1) methyltransferase [Schizosaccharomyces pombe 972h-]CAB52732.1 conserved eukaryotic protein, DUF3321 family [Schizosaccharomyces pombe]|eukprot:NP_592906.1 uncharacterized protein SPAC630.10 [Schizosaccharomyces pombe]